jgi:ABC-type bacteriocin/lantibiotic exporter with double-glycine peptidase domain
MGFIDWAFPITLLAIVAIYLWSQSASSGSFRRIYKETMEEFLKQGKEMLERLDGIEKLQTQIDQMKRELEEMKEK